MDSPPLWQYRKLIECNVTDGRQLVLDLLSVHLIRKRNGSVIISYHPTRDTPITTAPYLHERIRFAGKCPRIGSFFWHYSKLFPFTRTERLLAKHFSTIPGSHVCAPNFHMAYGLCMGWGARSPIQSHMYNCKSCHSIFGYLFTALMSASRKVKSSQRQTSTWPRNFTSFVRITYTIPPCSKTCEKRLTLCKIPSIRLWILFLVMNVTLALQSWNESVTISWMRLIAWKGSERCKRDVWVMLCIWSVAAIIYSCRLVTKGNLGFQHREYLR